MNTQKDEVKPVLTKGKEKDTIEVLDRTSEDTIFHRLISKDN